MLVDNPLASLPVLALSRGGERLPGEALPSINALASQYEVSLSTTARAVAVLADEGRVNAAPGWGTLVAGAQPDQAKCDWEPDIYHECVKMIRYGGVVANANPEQAEPGGK